MITLGIDLSSSREGTAAAVIEWNKSHMVVHVPALRCDDDQLDELIDRADVVGIDAPFGWPKAFVEAVAGWREISWSSENRRRLQFRPTDLFVRDMLGIWPLSVSTDRIALPAMRANALLTRHEVEDRSGDGKFYEVYPAATLKCWGLPHRGYKLLDPNCQNIRLGILRELRAKLQFLDIPNEYASTSDVLDALIACLTARLAFQKQTVDPQGEHVRSEGWIHFPRDGSLPIGEGSAK
jgi:predicted nuclease with RNAse H fold